MKANIGILFCLWISGVSAGYGLIGMEVLDTPDSTSKSLIAMVLSLGGWAFVFAYNNRKVKGS